MLVVDDLHWADRPSVRALVFALRRLVADQVLVVLAMRDDAGTELPESLRRVVSGHHGDIVRLAGLDEGDLRELAGHLGIAALPARAARRLRDGTRATRCTSARYSTRSPGLDGSGRVAGRPAAAPVAAVVPPLVGDRYAACGDDTRRLVDAAAVLGVRSPLPLAASVGEVGEPVQAVDEAVARGLLVAETARTPGRSPSRTRWCAPPSTTPSGRPGAGRCTSPRPSSSRTRSRYCTIGSPRRRRWTVRSPTTSRRSPAGRPPASSGRAPPATS